jgi:hypothetical protein
LRAGWNRIGGERESGDMKHVQSEFERGFSDSESDIASASPKLFWQTRGRWGEFLTQLMADRFSVAVEHTSDITNADEVSYRKGYNEATRRHVDHKFGNGTFQSAIAEVERFRLDYYKQRYRT